MPYLVWLGYSQSLKAPPRVMVHLLVLELAANTACLMYCISVWDSLILQHCFVYFLPHILQILRAETRWGVRLCSLVSEVSVTRAKWMLVDGIPRHSAIAYCYASPVQCWKNKTVQHQRANFLCISNIHSNCSSCAAALLRNSSETSFIWAFWHIAMGLRGYC